MVLAADDEAGVLEEVEVDEVVSEELASPADEEKVGTAAADDEAALEEADGVDNEADAWARVELGALEVPDVWLAPELETKPGKKDPENVSLMLERSYMPAFESFVFTGPMLKTSYLLAGPEEASLVATVEDVSVVDELTVELALDAVWEIFDGEVEDKGATVDEVLQGSESSRHLSKDTTCSDHFSLTRRYS